MADMVVEINDSTLDPDEMKATLEAFFGPRANIGRVFDVLTEEDVTDGIDFDVIHYSVQTGQV
jgi:hypothetical protein